jgi:hypothetical protein
MKLKWLIAVLLLCGPAPALSQSGAPAPGQDAARPQAPTSEAPRIDPALATARLAVGASFAGDNKPIRSGLVWRVLVDKGPGTPPVIVARSKLAEPVFNLEPGSYMIHAAYGFASGTRRITINASQSLSERLTVNAGALKLGGSIGDTPIPASRLSFSVFVPLQGNSEGRLVVANAKAGDIIRLPEGIYHVVSTYGDSNAIQRSDIKVEPGRLTEATLHHRAARVTLKLVANRGGEAFAGTAFSVLTPGGDVIREAIGAFPEMILAEGEYVLIARQEGQLFTRDFKVEAGLDRDIEVLAQPGAQPGASVPSGLPVQPTARRQ